MPVTQTRSQKSKVPQKMAARAVTVAAKPKRGNSEARPGPVLSAQERQRLVEQAAYFRAEKRGFAPGCELQDWVEAEAEVLRLIGCV
jgi:hypothetical protein